MSSRRQLMIIVAIVFGAIAAAAAYTQLGNATATSEANKQKTKVYVLGASAKRLDPGDKVVAALVKKDVAVADLPDGYVSAANEAGLEELKTRVAAYDLTKGQILVNTMLVDKTLATPQASYRLEKDKVAVSVSVDDVRGVGGNLQPGDYVNILATVQDPSDAASHTTYTLYQKVKILYIGNSPEPTPTETPAPGEQAQAAPQNTGIITFEVPPVAASRIVSASNMASGGGLWLTLVNPDYEPSDVPSIVDKADATTSEFAISNSRGLTPYKDDKVPE